jgi:mono/diheme cytochrome c family protein
MRFSVVLAALLGTVVARGATLEFVRDDTVVTRLDEHALAARCGLRTIEVDDPYYEAVKHYRACPLAAVLEAGFGTPVAALGGGDVLFRAADGYVKPATLARVAEDGGFVALRELARESGFAPMGPRRLDPGPFYVVWSKREQRDTHRYPWPYQLAAIEITDVVRRFPHLVPSGTGEQSDAWRGYTIFRTECVACHSMNGEGGAVGPDLNVPRSIVEYRPVEQLKAYIRNPAAFRYGNMPAHEHLSARDLDALVAYFRAMAARKHDPGGRR